MVDSQILSKYGSDNEAIKCLFTCEDVSKPEYKHRKAFEKRLCSRLNTGWIHSLQNSHLFAAADLAWDAAPIVKENIPLLLYAQKKITLKRCGEELESLGCASDFVRKDDAGVIKEIDLPRLYETSVNLVRSYLTRRLAPQATKYANLYPFLKFEPRATDLVGKLRGDVLSQRVEIMADEYGYRHLQTQIIRDMFLYGKCVLFPACAWDREVQWKKTPKSDALADNPEFTVDAQVQREGVEFVRPHPSRTFWDQAYPLSSINTPNGCNYVGFWDLKRYGDIDQDTNYFNRDKIRRSYTGGDLYSGYRLFFDSSFNTCKIKFTTLEQLQASDPALGNDLFTAAPFYQSTDEDETLFVSEYYEKVIPNRCGLGSYPFAVWLRLVVASDDTVVFGEFIPTKNAAVYFGYNENDNRAANISLAHEIMPFQDQVSNLLSQLLLTAKGNALRILTLDTDGVDDKIRTEIKKTLSGDAYYIAPILLEYSGVKMRNVGATGAANPLNFIEKRSSDDITNYFRSITQLLSIIERMMILSPQELGQAAPREISATETNAISNSTETVYGFISDSIDEGRAAWKRFIYESLVNKATAVVRVPVEERYSDDVVKAAGFQVVESDKVNNCYIAQQQVTGTKEKLIHDYAFSSRDGGDRSSNVQSANTLVQLLGQVINVPGVLEGMGKDKLYEIINEIFRMSGTGYDLKLSLKEGEENSFAPPQQEQTEQAMSQLEQAVQQLGGELQKQGQAIEQNQQSAEQSAEQTAELIKQLMQTLESVGAPSSSVATAPTLPGQTMPGVTGVPVPPPAAAFAPI